jgi:hypothetical protein
MNLYSRSLVQIAKDGTPEELQQAMNDESNVNIPVDDSQTTLLMLASAFNNDLRMVSWLLKNGAQVDSRNLNGVTALMAASGFNTNPQVVSALLDAGADVDAQDSDGNTSLMYSIVNNKNLDFSLALLNAGANVFAMNDEGGTALEYAVEMQIPFAVLTELVLAETSMSESIAYNIFLSRLKSDDPNLLLKNTEELRPHIINIEGQIEVKQKVAEDEVKARYTGFLSQPNTQKPELWETDTEFSNRLTRERNQILANFNAELEEVRKRILLENIEPIARARAVYEASINALSSSRTLPYQQVGLTIGIFNRNTRIWPIELKIADPVFAGYGKSIWVDFSKRIDFKDAIMAFDESVKAKSVGAEFSWGIDYNPDKQAYDVRLDSLRVFNTITNEIFYTEQLGFSIARFSGIMSSNSIKIADLLSSAPVVVAPAPVVATSGAPVSDGSQDLKISFQVNTAKGDVANNFITFAGNIRYMTVTKDQFDAVSGASKFGTTELFQSYLYDVEGKLTMSSGLRGLFLFAVSNYAQLTADDLNVTKAADGTITIQYAHRGTAQRITTDATGKLAFPNGKFEQRAIGYISGANPQVISKDFSTDGTAAKIDWAKVWDSSVAGGKLVDDKNATAKTGNIVKGNADPASMYYFDGALAVTYVNSILKIEGALTAVRR